MCQRVTCRSCGKPTYAGCGRHVEAVLGDVTPEARCRCRQAKAKPTAFSEKCSSWLSLFGGKASGRRS
jgi:hypothetical protein